MLDSLFTSWSLVTLDNELAHKGQNPPTTNTDEDLIEGENVSEGSRLKNVMVEEAIRDLATRLGEAGYTGDRDIAERAHAEIVTLTVERNRGRTVIFDRDKTITLLRQEIGTLLRERDQADKALTKAQEVLRNIGAQLRMMRYGIRLRNARGSSFQASHDEGMATALNRIDLCLSQTAESVRDLTDPAYTPRDPKFAEGGVVPPKSNDDVTTGRGGY